MSNFHRKAEVKVMIARALIPEKAHILVHGAAQYRGVEKLIMSLLRIQLIIIMDNYPSWGTVLGAPFKVPAYSNYGFKYEPEKVKTYQNYLPKEELGLERDVYLGFKYQCVEYARRFLVFTKRVAFLDVPCAYNIWPLKTVEDLKKEEGQFEFRSIPNGSQEAPEVGDLIIYPKSAEQRFGHVSVVINVNLENQYVDIAEQNYEEEGWECPEYSRRLILEVKDQGYHLTNRRIGKEYDNWDVNEQIYGWKRVIV